MTQSEDPAERAERPPAMAPEAPAPGSVGLAPAPGHTDASRPMHELFLLVNRWFAVPLLRAGFGPATQWYRNILVDPRVEVVLPGRTLPCRATEERDPDVRHRTMPVLVRALGLPGALGGIDPRRATDADIREADGPVPLVRLDPVDGLLTPGSDDPGGTAWIWREIVVAGLVLLATRALLAVLRRLLRLA